jgi:hypothetical protein
MNRSFPEYDELRGLLDALCEETITPEQVRRLEGLLLTNAAAEAYYVQFMRLYADLAGHFAAPTAGQALRQRLDALGPRARTGPPATPAGRGRRLRWGLAGLAALAAGVLVALVPWHRPVVGPPGPPPEPVDDTVAVLLQAPGAVWEPNGLPARAGGPLPPGWLRLRAGLAQIEFYSGATVILEGPAELRLVSRTEAYCARGRLRATVPLQAQGFRIGSPRRDLIDRGTEFGLQVDGDDRAEVHVFQGKVDLYDPGADPAAAPGQVLITGQGVRLEGGGGVRPIPLSPAVFETAQQVARRWRDQAQARQGAWQAASDRLRQDPTLQVYYTFARGEPWSRTLRDRPGPGRPSRDGAVVGCSWVGGRWPGKQALEFKRVSDRVRFTLPGDFDSVTLAAWVRVDALPNVNNSLMMTDGWEPGELHWQIGQTGTLILGVQNQPHQRGEHFHAPGALTPDRFGQWVHLAVVYDRAAGTVTHYVDGRPAVQLPTGLDVPLRVGDAELGNWNMASHRNNTPIRFFSGCMDEFMLFSRALGGDEVERLYDQGRPPW